ncbi:lantibiotic biosynthesis dehydratase-like protein [Saccharothrix carnea]|uniref:Lantibiotic biosynthesis dehydratase-like protein n=1 Tax=Saccharothrix carnea TaxID=1280637 RepID=A0A2P8HLP6_SACCR|nr:lantibiotic dehydratase C-terminal domain-containing protein [Saccharothrix carnea]PSL47137.1 lantibiotic biosynthesis dehydratase-like protein [Saccharothrix carnea]
MTDVVCYYYDPVKIPLLRDAVLPALAEARAAGAEGHLERHWLHGPHVRVRMDGPDDVVQAVADRLRAHLAQRPSTVDITATELLARSRRNGVTELVRPPYEPIHPDNTVVVEPTDTTSVRELHGSDVLVDLRTRTLRLGVAAVREAVATDRTSAGRVELALTAMAAHASRYPGGLVTGYHSFLSHLEDFLTVNDPDGVLRARFEELWRRNADKAVATVRAVHDGALDTEWTTWTVRSRELIEEVYDRGELPTVYNQSHGEVALELGDEKAIRRWHRDHRTDFSEYHRAVQRVDLDHPLFQRPVTVYRFGTNMLYQLLVVCDVTPVERYLAAKLLAEAAQRITGVTWSTQLAELSEVGR